MIYVELNQLLLRLALYKNNSPANSILRECNILQRLMQEVCTGHIVFIGMRTARELTDQKARKADDLLALPFAGNTVQQASLPNRNIFR